MNKLLPLLFLVIIVSCKKDDPPPPPTTTPPPVTTGGCVIDPNLNGTWISDSIRSWYTDSIGLVNDSTFATIYPQFYLEYQFYCIEDHPFGWNPDTVLLGPPGWEDHTYMYFKEVDGTSIDDTDGFDTFYYENGKFYLAATSPQDTAGLPFFVFDPLTTTNLTLTSSGANGIGGITYQSQYYTKQ